MKLNLGIVKIILEFRSIKTLLLMKKIKATWTDCGQDNSDKKIKYIIACRRASGLGLLECKQFVEKNFPELNWKP